MSTSNWTTTIARISGCSRSGSPTSVTTSHHVPGSAWSSAGALLASTPFAPHPAPILAGDPQASSTTCHGWMQTPPMLPGPIYLELPHWQATPPASLPPPWLCKASLHAVPSGLSMLLSLLPLPMPATASNEPAPSRVGLATLWLSLWPGPGPSMLYPCPSAPYLTPFTSCPSPPQFSRPPPYEWPATTLGPPLNATGRPLQLIMAPPQMAPLKL
ncbi:hypothetical protein E4T56_gene12018 [Termitomyces sp. T112]|nr:hypothetical protein E4T56_gene12018 [Termitomyces sp. T112]